MLEQFKSFLKHEQLIPAKAKTLLAVSGGVDSVVLCHLWKAANLDFGIAHCNFKLRGEASEQDAFFVKSLADTLEVPFWQISFDTPIEAQNQKKSIQEIARSLRYDWLKQIAQENGFQKIATAHHLNDAIETLFYNLVKGCGIRGLHGIPIQQGNIIRPLLFAQKEDIVVYAKEQEISFREDASNAEDKYARNLIRNQVIPILKKINPSLEKTGKNTLQNLKETEALFDFAVQSLRKTIVQEHADYTEILLDQLADAPAANTLIYEWLKDYGFHRDQLQNMLQAQVGSQFFSAQHRIIRHRNALILSKITSSTDRSYQINALNESLLLPEGQLQVLGSQIPPEKFDPNPNIALLDLDLIQFPLTLSRWQAGDYFKPLGMQGKGQKLQDYFSNQKLSILEKEKVLILRSNHEICWIVGHRIDERYKVSSKTKSCILIKWKASKD